MRNLKIITGIFLVIILLVLTACSSKVKLEDMAQVEKEMNPSTPMAEDSKQDATIGDEKEEYNQEKRLMNEFENITLSNTLKSFGYHNPLITQRLGADPYALVYNDRVYIYMTGDVVEYDGSNQVKNNSFSQINTLNVISSADLVNWTDHGSILAAGPAGSSKWGNNSWAPAIAYKEIDNKPKFFLYFANGGNGIGVLVADSPTGPFTDPLGKALISRSTPNCSNVSWLFDPAVFVDDDGTGYLYFGGGIPEEKYADPGTGRVVRLNEDMISLAGEPVTLDIPYLFEDSGINKIGDTYYYSYCSNWNVDVEASNQLGFNSAEIVYMTSKNPMGPFTLKGSILKNPGVFFGCYGTNHHCIFKFKNQMYIAYHTQILEERMGISGGYRCTHIDQVNVTADGEIEKITATEFGVKQIENLNPYKRTEAETMGTMGGIITKLYEGNGVNSGTGNMVVTNIEEGDWIAVYGVDFGEKGAKAFTAAVKPSGESDGAIEIRLDKPTGEVVGYLNVEAGESTKYKEIEIDLLKKITGEHNLIFVFAGKGYEIDYWYFTE